MLHLSCIREKRERERVLFVRNGKLSDIEFVHMHYRRMVIT
jgi:hypothetical protein